MPYILQDQPDEEVEIEVYSFLRTIYPIATLAHSGDGDLKAHIYKEDDCFVLVRSNRPTTHWFREAAEVLARLVSSEPLSPKTTASLPEGIPAHFEEVDSSNGSMVYLTETGPKKIMVIKGLRMLKEGLSLREAKQIVDSVSNGETYCLGSSPCPKLLDFLHAHGATTRNVRAPSIWEHLDLG